MILLYKLSSCAPSLVIAATLVGRRWGQTAAGLVAGFPIVAGPILFFYALEQGPAYAVSASQATLIGLFSLSFFALAYSLAGLDRRLRHPGAALYWAGQPLRWALWLGPAGSASLATLLGSRC